MLLEALDTKDEAIRTKIVQAMAEPIRTYLPTEAQLQGAEVVANVRRHRPHWLRQRPDTSEITKWENFWRRRVWQQARRELPTLAARREDFRSTDPAHDHLVRVQSANKAAYEETKREARRTGESAVQLDAVHDLLVEFSPNAPASVTAGWNGRPIDAWRHEIATIWWHGLVTVPRRARKTRDDTTLLDWVFPWVKPGSIASDRSSWNSLWYYEADITSVPRNWLHWAVFTAQLTSKAGDKAPGNPVDAQHASYLPDADVFITADRRYAAVLAHVLPHAPVSVPIVRLVDAQGDVIEQIRAFVEGRQ